MPYIGEIRMFAGNFPPQGWAFCQGQPLLIAAHDSLFTLIGTTYGGNGETTFNLPNLASRVPVHNGTGSDGVTYTLGQMAGTEQETLTLQQLPAHTHPLTGSTALASLPDPGGNVVAQSRTAGIDLYLEDEPSVLMAATSLGSVGGSQPHENMQPFLAINFIISLAGAYPSQT